MNLFSCWFQTMFLSGYQKALLQILINFNSLLWIPCKAKIKFLQWIALYKNGYITCGHHFNLILVLPIFDNWILHLDYLLNCGTEWVKDNAATWRMERSMFMGRVSSSVQRDAVLVKVPIKTLTYIHTTEVYLKILHVIVSFHFFTHYLLDFWRKKVHNFTL